MMLEQIIIELNNRLDGVGYFNKVYGLAELVEDIKTLNDTDIERSYPAKYIGSGNYERIDLEKQTCYIRQNGSVTQAENEEDAEIGCSSFVDRTFPLRLVFSVKKNRLKPDNAHSDERAVQTIINALQDAPLTGVQQAVNASHINLNVTEYTTDRYAVHESEHTGVRFDVKFEYVYGYIDFDVIVSGDLACFEDFVC